MEEIDRVSKIFIGQRIFLTGASGFVGKVILEKILRVCPEVDKIYILLREKKGKTPEQRIDEIFSNKLFDKLKEMYGKAIISKVIAVSGDVMYPNLGILPDKEKELIEQVTICFHGAASIRFDLPVKQTVLINTRGTKYFLELVSKFQNVKAIIHLSTAYCQLHEKILYEKTYPPVMDPNKVISFMELFDEDFIETISHKILKTYPNAYAFSKNLSEGLVTEYIDKLPIIILRPSILVPIWQGPYPGWTDNINGPTGLLIAGGKGVLRTMYADENTVLDCVPVDIAVNAILLVIFVFLSKKTNSKVFNLTSSHQVNIKVKDVIDIAQCVVKKTPLNGGLWYPNGNVTKYYWLHKLNFILFQLIPAYFLDIFIFLSGNKPVLVKVQDRLLKAYTMLEYYTNNSWDFRNEKWYEFVDTFNSIEKKKFKIDKEGLDYHDYFNDCILATRELLLKEMPDTLPAAKRHLRVLWWLDTIAKMVFGYLFLYYFVTKTPYLLELLITLMDTICSLLFLKN